MTTRCGLLIALALLACATARADGSGPPEPLQIFREDNPGLDEEDLIGFSTGDSIDRVLAVAYNPESGLAAEAVQVTELVEGVPTERALGSLSGRAGAAATGSYLVFLTQRCDELQPAPRMLPGSWLYLRDNRLVAWDAVVYAPDCSVSEERFEASDHAAMRVVGEELFRSQARGRFRYGALRYQNFDAAFVAPSREAMLSLLAARAADAPDDAQAQLHFGVGLYAAGDRDAALRRLQRAAELDPAAAEPHLDLAVVYRQRGDRAAAAREEALAAAGRGRASASAP